MGGKEFDMLSWFLQSPEFAAEWSHYKRQQSDSKRQHPEFENFSLYERIP
jgi:hypothetical protein